MEIQTPAGGKIAPMRLYELSKASCPLVAFPRIVSDLGYGTCDFESDHSLYPAGPDALPVTCLGSYAHLSSRARNGIDVNDDKVHIYTAGPDGIDFDADGNLYTGSFGDGRFWRLKNLGGGAERALRLGRREGEDGAHMGERRHGRCGRPLRPAERGPAPARRTPRRRQHRRALAGHGQQQPRHGPHPLRGRPARQPMILLL